MGVEFFEEESVAEERERKLREQEVEGTAANFMVDKKIARNQSQANFYLVLLSISLFFIAFILFAIGKYNRDQRNYYNEVEGETEQTTEQPQAEEL